MTIDRDNSELESFEASLTRFRAKLKKANDSEMSDPSGAVASDESDLPHYCDLDETKDATGNAIKKVIPL